MKKKLLGAILGLAAATAVFNAGNVATAQGQIWLDNYGTGVAPYPLITYGNGSGGGIGTPVSQVSGFTVGIYLSSTLFAFEGPTTVGGANTSELPGLQAVGAGSTAALGNANNGSIVAPGYYSSPAFLATPVAAGQNVYFLVLAYNGADYSSSTVRGHSKVLSLATASAPPIAGMGGLDAGFSVALVPEPSTFALAGLGLASLLIFRRRK